MLVSYEIAHEKKLRKNKKIFRDFPELWATRNVWTMACDDIQVMRKKTGLQKLGRLLLMEEDEISWREGKPKVWTKTSSKPNSECAEMTEEVKWNDVSWATAVKEKHARQMSWEKENDPKIETIIFSHQLGLGLTLVFPPPKDQPFWEWLTQLPS